jgi:CubicO group peptidase (beta-lactamase class C family)
MSDLKILSKWSKNDIQALKSGQLSLNEVQAMNTNQVQASDTNLVPLMQNAPVSVQCPLNPLDERAAWNAEIINTVSAGFHPSYAVHLNHPDYQYQIYTGYRDIENLKAANRDTIYRIASMSKVVGVITVLQYVEKCKIRLSDPVSKYIPEYANVRVLQLVQPTLSVKGSDVESTQGSNLIVLTVPDTTGLVVGQTVGLTSQPVAPPPPVQLYPPTGIFTITQIIGNQVTVQSTQPSQVTQLLTGLYQIDVLPVTNPEVQSISVPVNTTTLFAPAQQYYTTVAPNRPVTIRDLITHVSGHTYFDPLTAITDIANPVQLAVAAGIGRQLGLTQVPANATNNYDLVQWAKIVAQVPLAFQPGTAWSYGPHISIANAAVLQYERMKGRNPTLYKIQKKGIFDPLGVKSAFYFIQDTDSNRNVKIDNLVHSYATIDTALFGVLTLSAAINTLFFALLDTTYGTNYTTLDGVNPTQPLNNPTHPIYGSASPRKLELSDSGLNITTLDYEKIIYALAHLGRGATGCKILKKKTILDMSRNQIGPLFVTFAANPNNIGAKWGYEVAVGDQSLLTTPVQQTSMFWSGAYAGQWFVDIPIHTTYNNQSSLYLPVIDPLIVIQSQVVDKVKTLPVQGCKKHCKQLKCGC